MGERGNDFFALTVPLPRIGTAEAPGYALPPPHTFDLYALNMNVSGGGNGFAGPANGAAEDFSQDYSSLAGYGANSYYGKGTPQSLIPQHSSSSDSARWRSNNRRGNGGFRGNRRRGFRH